MKNTIALAPFYLALCMFACQDTRDVPTTAVNDVAFYKNIGTQISMETANRWINAYEASKSKAGRDASTPYNISPGQLDAALQSVTNPVGIAFHHAIDESGQHHFIAVPIDQTLSVWLNIPGRKYIDTNTNTEISRITARRWCDRFEDANENQVWFHFFGQNIFDEIVTLPYFNSIEIEPAINDTDLTPQLLLFVANDEVISSGRTSADGSFYDASSPCPPCPIK